jgi:hypothetical protein
MNDLNTLGSGITLYFRTLKALLFGLLAMTIVVLPTIFLCVTGNRISRGDFLGISSASIGNSGLVRNAMWLLMKRELEMVPRCGSPSR